MTRDTRTARLDSITTELAALVEQERIRKLTFGGLGAHLTAAQADALERRAIEIQQRDRQSRLWLTHKAQHDIRVGS